jgi:asparagine synthetase A
VRRIWKVLKGAETFIQAELPKLHDPRYPDLPEELTFLHAEEILDMYPDLPRKARETAILQKYPAVFIIGIGWTYHQAILNDQIPLSIGGGIGQSRTTMLLLKKAHLGEVSVTVWPRVLKEMCRRKNIQILE